MANEFDSEEFDDDFEDFDDLKTLTTSTTLTTLNCYYFGVFRTLLPRNTVQTS